jgi:hypothetical protein
MLTRYRGTWSGHFGTKSPVKEISDVFMIILDSKAILSAAKLPHDAAPSTATDLQHLWKRDGGCFVCLERHADA